MINICNLSKSFDDKLVLKDINLKIEKGSITALIGVNGAGKSTLLKSIMGIYPPDNGEVLIENSNVQLNPNVKQSIGFVLDKNNYFDKCKIKSILKEYELTYNNFNINTFNKANEIFKIPLNKKLEKLSKGNAARVFFMLALSISPKILILDEPTSGLDPIAKRNFFKILVETVYENKTTVIISSHNLNDLESICDRVVFLDNGEIVENKSLDTLKCQMKKIQVIFKDTAPIDFEKWSEFLSVEKLGKSYTVVTSSFTDELTTKLNNSGALFIEELDLSLEDMLVYKIHES